MESGLIKSQGQRNSFWSLARLSVGNWKKGMLNNGALAQARKAVEKLQKKPKK